MIKTSRLIAAGLLLLASQIRAEGHEMGPDDDGPMMAMNDQGGPGGPGMGAGPGGPGMRGEGGPGGGPEHILKQLDLSDAQKDKLKALRRARRDKNQARMNALQDAREDMKDLLGKNDRSKAFEDKLRARHAEVAKLEAEQAQDRFEAMLEVRSILTDSQLKKFVELKEKGPGMMGRGKRGMRRGHGGDKDEKGGDDKDEKRP